MADLNKSLLEIKKILTRHVEQSSKIDEILEYIEDEIDNQFDEDEYDGASDEELPDVLPDSHNSQSIKIIPKVTQSAQPTKKSQSAQPAQPAQPMQGSQQNQQSTVVMALKQPTGTMSMVSSINQGKILIPVSKKLDNILFVTEYYQDASNNIRTKVKNYIEICDMFDHLKNNKEKYESVAHKIATKLKSPYAIKEKSLVIGGKHSAEELKQTFKSLWKPKV